MAPSAMAWSQAKSVKRCFHSELEQEAEADLLLGDHREAGCCSAQASLAGHCWEGPSSGEVLNRGEDNQMRLLGRPECTQEMTEGVVGMWPWHRTRVAQATGS